MNDNEYLYSLKPSLITNSEKAYLTAIKNCLPDGYFVQPQVNLASIITKNSDAKYQNELYRNIDACIFDMSYKPIVLIEINDVSHNDYYRKNRDIKVKNICEEAGIKIITFWTKYGVNQDYISKTVNEAIVVAPNIVRIKHSSDKLKNTEQISQSVEKTPEPFIQNNYNNSNNYNQPQPEKKNGCYIATSVYGSYDCANVWVLRRYRDYELAQNIFGRCFIRIYYALSPILVKWFGDKRWFKSFWKKALDHKVNKLKRIGYSDKPYNDLY